MRQWFLLLLIGSLASLAAAEEVKTRVDIYGDPLPDGAVVRLGSSRLRHVNGQGNDYRRPQFSPDSALIATCANGQIRLWQTQTGKLIREMEPKLDTIQSFAFSPDSKEIAIAYRDRFVFLDVANGKSIREWKREVLEGRKRVVLEGGRSTCAFSSDGKLLVEHNSSGGQNGIFSVWERTTGKVVSEANSVPPIRSWRFDPTKMEILFLVSDRQNSGKSLKIGVLDLAASKTNYPFEVLGFYSSAVMSSDGNHLAAVETNRDDASTCIRFIDVKTGKKLHAAKCETEWTRMVFSADGKTLYGLDADDEDGGRLVAFDVASGKQLRDGPLPSRFAYSLIPSPDGKTLLTLLANFGAVLLDATTGKPVHKQPTHHYAVSELAFSGDGKSIISRSSCGISHVWDAQTGKHLRESPYDWKCGSALASGSGRTIFAAGFAGEIRQIDLSTGKTIREFQLNADGKDEQIHIGSISQRGPSLLATEIDRGEGPAPRGFWFAAATGKLHSIIKSERPFTADVLIADGLTAFGSASLADGQTASELLPARFELVKLSTGQRTLFCELSGGPVSRAQEFPGYGLHMFVETKLVDSDGNEFDRRLGHVLLERHTGRERLHLSLGKEYQLIYSPRAVAHESVMAHTHQRGEIHVLDLRNGKKLGACKGHDCHIAALAMHPDGKRVAAGYADGTVLIWDISKFLPPHRPKKYSPDELQKLWRDLADADAKVAYAAMGNWSEADNAVEFLRRKLKPAAVIEAKSLEKLLDQLNSPRFVIRERAGKELGRLLLNCSDEQIEQLKKSNLSVDQLDRLDKILRTGTLVTDAELLRKLRAVEVLGTIRTNDARELLESLARGAPAARLTREAAIALQR